MAAGDLATESARASAGMLLIILHAQYAEGRLSLAEPIPGMTTAFPSGQSLVVAYNLSNQFFLFKILFGVTTNKFYKPLLLDLCVAKPHVRDVNSLYRWGNNSKHF